MGYRWCGMLLQGLNFQSVGNAASIAAKTVATTDGDTQAA